MCDTVAIAETLMNQLFSPSTQCSSFFQRFPNVSLIYRLVQTGISKLLKGTELWTMYTARTWNGCFSSSIGKPLVTVMSKWLRTHTTCAKKYLYYCSTVTLEQYYFSTWIVALSHLDYLSTVIYLSTSYRSLRYALTDGTLYNNCDCRFKKWYKLAKNF